MRVYQDFNDLMNMYVHTYSAYIQPVYTGLMISGDGIAINQLVLEMQKSITSYVSSGFLFSYSYYLIAPCIQGALYTFFL